MTQEIQERLVIAVPNGFREIGEAPSRHTDASKLAVPARRLFEIGCYLPYVTAPKDPYWGFADNFPVEFVEMRGQDIPRAVSDSSNVHLGIVGTDRYENSTQNLLDEIEVVRRLGFGKCEFRLGVPAGSEKFSQNSRLEDVKGLRIATGLNVLTKRIFRDRGVDAKIILMSGHVETAVRYNLADVIIDITETGETMRRNDLIPAESLGTFEAVLIGDRRPLSTKIQSIKDELLKKIDVALECPEIWLTLGNTNGNGTDGQVLRRSGFMRFMPSPSRLHLK